MEKTRPDAVIAVDALASRALSRVNTTIQVADTGIHPGSGVGNKRKALNRESLGIPVIAIGIPTVVDAATIAHDSVEMVISYLHHLSMNQKQPTNPLRPLNRPNLKEIRDQKISSRTSQQMLGMVGTLDSEEKRRLINEVLNPLGQNLIVTPKEVDMFIGDMGKLVADGLNCALHEAITPENVSAHIN